MQEPNIIMGKQTKRENSHTHTHTHTHTHIHTHASSSVYREDQGAVIPQ